MTPYDQAEQLMLATGWDIDRAICSHLVNGWMVSTPDFFALIRPISRGWPHERLANPYDADPAGDTLWIWCFAGDFKAAVRHLTLLPVKKWVAFSRRDSPPRYYPYDRLRPSDARAAGQPLGIDPPAM